VERKIKDRIGEQTIEDYDFLEDLTLLIKDREIEKTKELAQNQLKQQQQMREKRNASISTRSPIVIGKFGMT